MSGIKIDTQSDVRELFRNEAVAKFGNVNSGCCFDS